MMVRPHPLASVIVALVIALCNGCAVKTAPAPSPPASYVQSGFLTDYTLLRPGADDQVLLRYRNPNADFSKYDKILFDRVHVWRTQSKSLDDIEESELQRLADDLYTAIRTKLEEEYTLVDVPTDDAMEIHIALTDVDDADVALDVFTTLAISAPGTGDDRRLTAGTQSFVGSAMIEIEINDTTTQDVLFAGVDRHVAPEAIPDALETWSDVDRAFAHWAARIATGLDRARRGKL
jgi:hypothetical protein